MHLPDLGAGFGDETFPPDLGRAKGLSKAYALQPSSQHMAVLCLETLSNFRNRSVKSCIFLHFQSLCLLSGVRLKVLNEIATATTFER